MSNQLDFIDNRFFHQRVKVLKVICQKNIQEFGDLTIVAPVGLILDPVTGLLNSPVTLELAGTPQLRTVTVLPDKIINQGVVPVSLLVDGVVSIQSLEIPFQAVIECPGAMPGDIVQKHDFQIEGFSITPVQLPVVGLPTLQLNLVLKVVVEFCLVVASERILKVDAAETFC
ncbi:MAG: DUF3794 domain-containing protein [Clostridia bacterium]